MFTIVEPLPLSDVVCHVVASCAVTQFPGCRAECQYDSEGRPSLVAQSIRGVTIAIRNQRDLWLWFDEWTRCLSDLYGSENDESG